MSKCVDGISLPNQGSNGGDNGNTEFSASELYKKYSEAIYYNAIKWLKEHPNKIELAKDVRSNVAYKIVKYSQKKSFSEIGNIESWLFVVTKHCAFDAIKQVKNLPRSFPVMEDIYNEVVEVWSEECEAYWDETSYRIVIIISEMDSLKKKIVELRFFKKMRIKAIAEELSVPASTVRGQLQSAIKKMKSILIK
jgi:RNA polymerase sigma factor (sigma-70 family)